MTVTFLYTNTAAWTCTIEPEQLSRFLDGEMHKPNCIGYLVMKHTA